MPRIIVTIGPSSISKSVLNSLIRAGADSFRINLSHSSTESLESYIDSFEECGITPSIDTQGAQLRIDEFLVNKSVDYGSNVLIHFGGNPAFNQSTQFIRLNHPEAASQAASGDLLRIDFGGFSTRLKDQIGPHTWTSEVSSIGPVTANRAVDIIGKSIRLNILTNFDKQAIAYAVERGCREIYASFVSDKSHIETVRKEVNDSRVRLISKIETSMGVANAREIISSSDEVLIDRGDLSREIGIPSVPIAVSAISQLAKHQNKPLNVATNILDSMMHAPIPSRAEISDIFNLFEKDVNGFVLAAEVAIGKNPVASTAVLRYILDLYSSHKYGLYGIASHAKPSASLVGNELLNWI